MPTFAGFEPASSELLTRNAEHPLRVSPRTNVTAANDLFIVVCLHSVGGVIHIVPKVGFVPVP